MIVPATPEDFDALRRGRAPRSFRLPDTPVAADAILDMLAALAARISASFTPAAWLLVCEDEGFWGQYSQFGGTHTVKAASLRISTLALSSDSPNAGNISGSDIGSVNEREDRISVVDPQAHMPVGLDR